jgi:hypothetical protein
MTQDTDQEGNPAGHDEPPLSDDAIRRRAYEISERSDAGLPEENWDRAVAELQAERRHAEPATETAPTGPTAS